MFVYIKCGTTNEAHGTTLHRVMCHFEKKKKKGKILHLLLQISEEGKLNDIHKCLHTIYLHYTISLNVNTKTSNGHKTFLLYFKRKKVTGLQ